MKKLFKLLLKLAVVLVVLLVAAVITLKIMFPPEKLKAMALTYAKENLHREITFDDVSLNLIGVTLDNFAISEDSTFQQGTFAKADKLVVKIALKPLFKKRVEIGTVSLDGLNVNVIKQKNGSFNFDSLLSAFASDEAAPKAAEEKKDSASSDFSLMADYIAVTNCTLSYKDLQTGMSAGIDKLNVEILDFDMQNPFEVKINFTTDYQEKNGPAVSLPVKIDVLASLENMDLQKAYATVKNIGVTYKTIKLNLWGGVKNFEKPEAEISGKISGISNKTFADFLPDLPVFALPEINVNSKISADLDKSSATVRSFALSIMDSAVTGAGTANWGGPALTYSGKADIHLMLGQISQITAMLDAYGLDGQIKGSVNATSKNNGKDITGQVTLENLTVKYEPVVASNINGVIKINSADNVQCDSLKGLLNGEVFTSSFSYLNVKDVMNLVFNLDLSKLTLSSFPSSVDENRAEAGDQPAAQPAASAGPETFMNVKANVKIGPINVPYFEADGFSVNADLKNVSASMVKTSGAVTFSLKPGAIKDLDLFVKESKIVKIILLPISIVKKVAAALNVDIFPQENAADKGKIKYTSAEGAYTFTNGVMKIDKTNFTSKLTNLNADGTANFKDGALDMKVSATVLTSQTPIVIKIGGTMDNPSGKLDVLNTVGSLVGGILNYKTPGKVIQGTADAAGAVATGAVKTTGKVAGTAVKTGVDVGKTAVNVGTDTVKGTVNVAKDALKGIGSLFKKSSKEEEQKENASK